MLSMKQSHRIALSNAQPNLHPRPDKQAIEHLYLDKLMSGRQVALYFDVDQPMVRRWLKYYGIPTRTRAEAASGRPKRGRNHFNWKGDDVGYNALHAWVRSRKGTPNVCEHCKRSDKKKYEWANVSKEYHRDLDDWIRLCTACHRKFDSI